MYPNTLPQTYFFLGKPPGVQKPFLSGAKPQTFLQPPITLTTKDTGITDKSTKHQFSCMPCEAKDKIDICNERSILTFRI